MRGVRRHVRWRGSSRTICELTEDLDVDFAADRDLNKFAICLGIHRRIDGLLGWIR